jgi:hypothetical protein
MNKEKAGPQGPAFFVLTLRVPGFRLPLSHKEERHDG